MQARSTTALMIATAALVVAAPLAGVALAGRPLSPYLAFPPTTAAAPHASFSWPVFLGLAVLVLASLAPFAWRVARTAPALPRRAGPRWARKFPAWGYAGVVLVAGAWWLAWHRHPWFEPGQRHVFTPLWLGYVLTVNALAEARSGRCLLTARPRLLLALFPVSAGFWWLFEYLNRFVRNWHYEGVADRGAWAYFWEATLPFSTVLPAVASTQLLLASFPRLSAGLGDAWRVRPARRTGLAVGVLAVALAGLAGIGLLPRLLFPLVWVAPLLVLLSLAVLAGRRTLLDDVARGDWSGAWQAALAALVCGFFWELWNAGSVARWEYALPFVDRFRLFEMPLLGYAGYLPFGLLCVTVAQLVGGEAWSRPGER